jgi:hypothetical protein
MEMVPSETGGDTMLESPGNERAGWAAPSARAGEPGLRR